MKKYAKIISGMQNPVLIGSGDKADFYKKNGFELHDVEKGSDNNWYITGYAPQETNEQKAKALRQERDALLQETDKFLIEDFPISPELKEKYKQYRQYLRDIPKASQFPDVEVLTFSRWQ